MNKIIEPRLQWACRRGMLELDLLLSNFLNEAFLTLPSEDQALFIALLNENDQDLFLWLTGKEIPKNQEISRIVKIIRDHAEHRH